VRMVPRVTLAKTLGLTAAPATVTDLDLDLVQDPVQDLVV
jgi:hypothetical protein